MELIGRVRREAISKSPAYPVRSSDMILIKAPFRRQGIITVVKNPYPGRKPYEILYKTPSILLRHQRKATQLRGHLA